MDSDGTTQRKVLVASTDVFYSRRSSAGLQGRCARHGIHPAAVTESDDNAELSESMSDQKECLSVEDRRAKAMIDKQ